MALELLLVLCTFENSTLIKTASVTCLSIVSPEHIANVSTFMSCGETARSTGERASEHLVRYEQNEKNSVFYKHMLDGHDSVPQDINVETLATCSDDAMLRQVTEAVLSMN